MVNVVFECPLKELKDFHFQKVAINVQCLRAVLEQKYKELKDFYQETGPILRKTSKKPICIQN